MNDFSIVRSTLLFRLLNLLQKRLNLDKRRVLSQSLVQQRKSLLLSAKLYETLGFAGDKLFVLCYVLETLFELSQGQFIVSGVEETDTPHAIDRGYPEIELYRLLFDLVSLEIVL